MTERHVRIDGEIFLYNQKAPFEASGLSVFAAIEYDPEKDKLRCHECGDWFQNLGTHAWVVHGLFARDYKIRHGLKLQSALVNEHTRVACSQRMTTLAEENPEASRELASKARSAALRCGRLGPLKRPRSELINKRGHCPPQLLLGIKQLAGKLGHTPSKAELVKAKLPPKSILFALNVKTIGAAMSLADLVPNKPGTWCKYTTQVLIEMLRDFYVAHGRLPSWGTDYRRGLVPPPGVYRYRFGSINQAYRAAGLGLVAAAELGLVAVAEGGR